MEDQKLQDISFSKEMAQLLYLFEIEKIATGITFLDFLKYKGLLFNPDFIVDESQEIIEEHRLSSTPQTSLIISIIGAVILGVGAFLFTFLLGNINEEIGFALGMLCFFGAGAPLYFGLRAYRVSLIVYKDRLVFKRILGSVKIYWHEIKRVKVWEKVTTYRYKSDPFWADDRKEYSVFLDFTQVNDSELRINLKHYGLGRAYVVVERLLQIMKYFNPKIKFDEDRKPTVLRKKLEKTYSRIESAPGQALERALNIMIVYENNNDAWKLMSMVLTKIMPEEAIPFIETALQQTPNDIDLWIQKGLVNEHLGLIALAEEAYTKALSIEPKNAIARKNYNRITGNITEDIDSGVEEIEKIKEIIVSQKEIQKIKRLIGDQKMVKVNHLESLTTMFKDKIIKIATEHLGFTLNKDTLVYEEQLIDVEHKVRVKQIERIIGSKEETYLDYIQVITKIPLDELVKIIEIDLGLIVQNDKVIQKTSAK